MSFRDYVPEQRFQPTLAISPDGAEVAFSANTSGQYNVWVARLDGASPPRPVTHFTDLAVRSVAWSPDGRHLAFAADQGGDEQHQIYLVDAIGGDLRRISTVDGRQHHLAPRPFSHDGRWLAFAGNDRDEAIQDLVVHDLGSGTVRRVESTSGLLLSPVAFTPDDTRLLASGDRSNTDSDACVVDLTATTPVLDIVTAHDGEAANVPMAWLGDGPGFYFMSDGGGEYRTVHVFDLDGRSARPFQPAGDSEWDVEGVATTDDSSVVWTVNEAGISVLYRHAGDVTERCELPAGGDRCKAWRGRSGGLGVGFGVPAVDVVVELVVEDSGADLKEAVGAVWAPAHLLLLGHPFRDDLIHCSFGGC